MSRIRYVSCDVIDAGLGEDEKRAVYGWDIHIGMYTGNRGDCRVCEGIAIVEDVPKRKRVEFCPEHDFIRLTSLLPHDRRVTNCIRFSE